MTYRRNLQASKMGILFKATVYVKLYCYFQQSFNDWYVVYIDRHNKMTKSPCGSNLIGGFTFEVDRVGNKYKGTTKYDFQCRKAPFKKNCEKKSTKPMSDEGGYVQALSSHNIDCGEGFIKGFEFNKRVYKNKKYQYNYWCCKM